MEGVVSDGGGGALSASTKILCALDDIADPGAVADDGQLDCGIEPGPAFEVTDQLLDRDRLHRRQSRIEPAQTVCLAERTGIDHGAQPRPDALAERPMWRSLGHYRPNLLGSGDHSLIDSPGFFNAADGKTNPASEIEATLGAFFADVVPKGSEQHERSGP